MSKNNFENKKWRLDIWAFGFSILSIGNMNKINFMLILFLSLAIINCDDSINEPSKEEIADNVKYYPLANNNLWIYEISHNSNSLQQTYKYYVKKEITGKTSYINLKYYNIKETAFGVDSVFWTESDPKVYGQSYEHRVDSSSGQIRQYSGNTDSKWIDLMMAVGEKDPKSNDAYIQTTVESEKISEIFGIEMPIKQYKISSPYESKAYWFAKDFGVSRFKFSGDFAYYDLVLIGAVIDNIVYGDTSVVK